MTAAEARALTDRFGLTLRQHTEVLLVMWKDAIHQAATVGRNWVLECDLPLVRTPLDKGALLAAKDALRGLGYTVEYVTTGLNERTYRVSW